MLWLARRRGEAAAVQLHIFGHDHQAALEEITPADNPFPFRQWYVNTGSWLPLFDEVDRISRGEVQLPFLKSRCRRVEVLPICLGPLDLNDCLDLGHSLAEIIGELNEPVGIVASSDMSHFEPDDATPIVPFSAVSELDTTATAGSLSNSTRPSD